MIDLYRADNTTFEKNGNMELLPISCIVSAEINGSWSLDLIHPIDEDNRWKEITEGAILKVKSFNGKQLFRVKKVTKQDSGLQAYAEPIFLDAIGDCFVYDTRPTNATGEAALRAILSSNDKYSASSNIGIRNTAYYVLKNAMECIASDDDNAFLKRWGGEIEYNNLEIIINERLGADNGVELLYGKNIPTDGMRETVSIADVVTRIIPKAFNGRLISQGNKYVDSPIINTYPTITTKVVEYPHIKLRADLTGEAEDGDIICDTEAQLNTALRSAAAEEFSEGNIDKPLISIECDMILLQNTEEYKDFADLERVSLGDTIHCNHTRLGIRSDARIVALTWNCLTESVETASIGSVMPNYLQRVESVMQRTEKAITPEGDVVASRVMGFLDAARTQMRVQSTSAEPVDVKAILFEDLDSASPTFGALAIGTQGVQISKTRQNDEWVWGTAINFEGIIADYIIAGILSDRTASNYWNLDTGKIVANNIEVKGDIKSGSTITGSSISGGTITGGAISGGTVTGSTISGSTITSQATVGQVVKTASLNQGKVEFTQTNSSAPTNDSTTTIDGYGVTFKRPNGGVPITSSLGLGLNVSIDGTNQSVGVSGNSITVDNTASGGNLNRVSITSDNIRIYVNGQVVWSAR